MQHFQMTNSDEVLILLELMTKTERKICLAFLWFYEQLLLGKHSQVYPELSTIAKITGCSTRTVLRFIKKFDGQIFQKQSRTTTHGKQTSNLYLLDNFFFEWVMIFDKLGYIANWETYGHKEIINNIHADPDYFLRLLDSRGLLEGIVMNMKCHTASGSKCHTIDSPSLIYSFVMKLKKKRSSVMNRKEEDAFASNAAKEKLPAALSDPNVKISFIKKKSLVEELSPLSLDYGIRCLKAQNLNGKSPVRDHAGFIWSRARDYTLKQMTRRQ